MKFQKITVILFFFLLALIPLLIFLLPKEVFSQEENRYLADFPTLSLRAIADKEFMDGFDEYAADHFPLRTSWIQMKTGIEHLSGQKEVNGVYILNDRLIEKVDTIDEDSVHRSIKEMNIFAERFGGSTSLMLIPTAAEIYRDKLPKGAPGIAQKEQIDRIYGQVRNISTIDAYSSLMSNAQKLIFYRSDHHWTSFGAYLGYSAMSKQLGYTPVPAERFNVEHASHRFRGSLYNKIIYDRVEPDSIDLYTYGDSSHVDKVEIFDGTKWTETDDIYFRDYLNQKDQYSVFLGQSQPIVTIHTDAASDSNLLIFKDSFSHSLVPFLALHYSKITLVDLRYLTEPFENWIDLDDYQQALFCYNFKDFAVNYDIQNVNIYK